MPPGGACFSRWPCQARRVHTTVMRTAVFGGSFDPPHLGHVLACLWALECGEVDRVVLIPVARHAFGKVHGAPFEHRLEMCRRAVARLGGGVLVSDIEARREGVSYMVDTLRLLREELPDTTELRLLVGSDVAADVPRWRNGAEVVRLAPVLELPRPHPEERFGDRPGALPPISSTEARRALAQQDAAALRLLIPASVREYIATQNLYRPGAPTP